MERQQTHQERRQDRGRSETQEMNKIKANRKKIDGEGTGES